MVSWTKKSIKINIFKDNIICLTILLYTNTIQQFIHNLTYGTMYCHKVCELFHYKTYTHNFNLSNFLLMIINYNAHQIVSTMPICHIAPTTSRYFHLQTITLKYIYIWIINQIAFFFFFYNKIFQEYVIKHKPLTKVSLSQ